MNLSWRDFDRAMPRRSDQPNPDQEPAAWPLRCSWCSDAPEPGDTLCRKCRRDLDYETRLYHGDTP